MSLSAADRGMAAGGKSSSASRARASNAEISPHANIKNRPVFELYAVYPPKRTEISGPQGGPILQANVSPEMVERLRVAYREKVRREVRRELRDEVRAEAEAAKAAEPKPESQPAPTARAH